MCTQALKRQLNLGDADNIAAAIMQEHGATHAKTLQEWVDTFALGMRQWTDVHQSGEMCALILPPRL